MTERGLQLLLLAAAMATAGYTRTAISPLQEAMRIALSLSDNQMSILQGPVIGIPVAIAAIPLGFLIDRTARRGLLILLIALSASGSVLTAMTADFGLLLLARGVAGLAGLSVVPVVFAILSDLYPPDQRGRVFMVALVGQVAGNSAAFGLGGALLAMTEGAPDGWRWSMGWLCAPLAPILFSMFLLREPHRAHMAIMRPSAREIWHGLRPTRAVISILTMAIVIVEIAIGALLIWGAPMLSRNYGLPPDSVGTIMGTGILLSGILGPVLGGAIADVSQRKGGPRLTFVLLAAMSLLSAPVGLFAFVKGAGAASLLLGTLMTILLTVVTMGIALFSIVIPKELRGLGMSVLVAACVLFALAVAPPAVSLLSGVMGGLSTIGSALSIVCVTTSVLAAMSFALGSRFVSSTSR
jgi:MFS family permease